MSNHLYKKIGGGLVKDKPDKRDFSLGGIFGTINIKDVPMEDFIVGTSPILDQQSTDFCTAFALTAISAYQEGISLSPEYTFAQIKRARGEFEEWGASLKDGLKVAKNIGFLPKDKAPFSLEDKDDSFLRNWSNWPAELDVLAAPHKKEAYFTVDGQRDRFDSIRAALWQFKNEKRGIYTGSLWRSEWTFAKNGIIPTEQFQGEYGHAWAICGQKIINGEPYLVAQLSNGTEIGDGGFFYFPRSVINRELYNAYMFKDLTEIPKEKIVELLKTEVVIHKDEARQFWYNKLKELIQKFLFGPAERI